MKMFNSYFHLKFLVQELQEKIESKFITSAFTFAKRELHISISDGSDIYFCANNPLPFLTYQTRTPSPKDKVLLFKDIYRLQISKILLNRSDRQLLISFNNDNYYLLVSCYGTNGNVFLLDGKFAILESFRKTSTDKQSNHFQMSDFKSPDSISYDPESIENLILTYGDRSLEILLKNIMNKRLDKVFVNELFARTGLRSDKKCGELSGKEIELLNNTLKGMLDEIEAKNFYIYYGELPVFSLLKLSYLKNNDLKIFANCTTATNEFIKEYLKNFYFIEEKRNLIRIVEKYIAATQRKLLRQKQDLKNIKDPSTYKEWAETILANYHKVNRKADFVILPRLHNPAEKIKIPLIRGLTPNENAKRYFEKAKNIEKSREILKKTVIENENSLDNAKKLLQKLGSINSRKELKSVKKLIQNNYLPTVKLKEHHEKLPYQLISYKNWDILIGKSARDNDILTFKIARPNDFWFHAQNVPGSHVIVRNPNKRDSLPSEITKVAAGLAAFNSKDKSSKLVPVVYTKKKYVWKPKKSNPGIASYKFEKSIIVEPINPQAIQGKLS